MDTNRPQPETPPSRRIDERIEMLGDWRGDALAQVRAVIRRTIPDIVEEWKWRGVPVWSCGSMICTGESHRDKVKLTFAKGASLPDPAGLFNASLDGGVRRAIDIREGEAVDETALAALVRAAAALNHSGSTRSARRSAAPRREETHR